jgi:ABC-type bacteriocin/lantibiotic exporter with double-glycine peptidase domain
MPKVHNIGTKRFVQHIDFPVKWGWKLIVRGWTQEIEPPFRVATPLIVRLPRHKALVFGIWNGQKSEEEALSAATGMRILSNEDFEEGWTPAAYENPKESSWHSDF